MYDVAPIGAGGTYVGFSGINGKVHEMLGEGDIKEHCKDVDFDPDDQGKGYADYFRQYFLDN